MHIILQFFCATIVKYSIVINYIVKIIVKHRRVKNWHIKNFFWHPFVLTPREHAPSDLNSLLSGQQNTFDVFFLLLFSWYLCAQSFVFINTVMHKMCDNYSICLYTYLLNTSCTTSKNLLQNYRLSGMFEMLPETLFQYK